MFKFKPTTIGGLKFKSVEYHRNGVSGDGFYCAIVKDPNVTEEFDGSPDMLITYFAIEEHCCCAVYKLDRLPDIGFGSNSWRGDQYVDRMKKAVIEYKKQFNKHYGITCLTFK